MILLKVYVVFFFFLMFFGEVKELPKPETSNPGIV